MKRYLKKCLFILIMVIACMLPTSVSAATTKEKALAAYKTFLSQKTIHWRDVSGQDTYSYLKARTLSKMKFTIAYVDNNTVPELVLYQDTSYPGIHTTGQMMLYTYQNSKVTYVATLRDLGVTSGTFRYIKKKGVFIDNDYSSGIDTINYRRLISGKAVVWLARARNYANKNANFKVGTCAYFVKGTTRITYKCYLNQREKIAGSASVVKASFHANTAANRNTYLK